MAVTSCASDGEPWDLDIAITELAPAPFAARTDHSLIWSGEELIVWGGHGPVQDDFHDDGAVYDPETGSWREMADTDLRPRTRHTSVAVGERMLVWGGFTPAYEDEGAQGARDGAIYDPESDSWERVADAPQAWERAHAAVLGEHVVFGGGRGRSAADSLLVYSVAEDAWDSVPLNRPAEPPQVYGLMALGDEAVVIGGTRQDVFVGRFRVGDTDVGLRPVRGLDLVDDRPDYLGLAASADGGALLAVRSGGVTTMYALDRRGRAEPVDDVDGGAFRPAVSVHSHPLMSGRMGTVAGLGVVASAPGDLSLWEVGTGRARRIQVPSLDGYCGTFVPAGEGVLFGWGGAGCDTGGVRIDIASEPS